jgi:hypothetical protein
MSNARVPGPIGSGGNIPTIDDGTLQRTLSRVPGIIGAPTNVSAEHSARPPLLSASRGGVKPPPTVQFGSRGPLVQRLQRLLNERLSPSPQLAINGNFDAATLAAVKLYQQHLRLNVDGRVGRDTWYRLHKGDIATVPGAPKPVEKIIAPTKPNISTWTLEQKFSRVLELTPPKLPGHMREEFQKLLDPTVLAIIVGTLIVWAASHAFGVGVIVDIAMLIGGVVFIGMAAFDAAGHLYDFLTLTATADEESDLDQASVMLAKAVSILGVGAFAALVTKGAAKRGAKKTAPPEPKPMIKDPGPKVARDEPKSTTPSENSTKTDAPNNKKEPPLKTNPQDIRLAAKSWPPEKKARFDTADKFYKDAGYKDYDSHLRGIDFDKPVDVVRIEAKEKVYQYSYLDRVTGEPKVGSYFYKDANVDPGKLGFDVGGRKMIETEVTTPSNFLRSSAANIEDWNGSGAIFKGGETQLFNPNASLSKATIL